jgi:hypothetical protein
LLTCGGLLIRLLCNHRPMLGESTARFAACRNVGQAIVPAAAFQAALSALREPSYLSKRRLKAGCSQEWLPHNAPRNST